MGYVARFSIGSVCVCVFCVGIAVYHCSNVPLGECDTIVNASKAAK